MTIAWTLAGTIGQILLAYFLFMLVVFSAAGIANNLVLGTWQLRILNVWIFLALCVLSAIMVMYLHARGGRAACYWWYALPVAATCLYILNAVALTRVAVPE